jgi:nitrate/nitrite-specific signal transduction histidine kinase
MAHVVAFSDATEASVLVETQPGTRDIRVVITDNGQGEESSVSATRLARIRDGLTTLGGQMDVRRSHVDGMTVVLTVPASRRQ